MEHPSKLVIWKRLHLLSLPPNPHQQYEPEQNKSRQVDEHGCRKRNNNNMDRNLIYPASILAIISKWVLKRKIDCLSIGALNHRHGVKTKFKPSSRVLSSTTLRTIVDQARKIINPLTQRRFCLHASEYFPDRGYICGERINVTLITLHDFIGLVLETLIDRGFDSEFGLCLVTNGGGPEDQLGGVVVCSYVESVRVTGVEETLRFECGRNFVDRQERGKCVVFEDVLAAPGPEEVLGDLGAEV